MQHQPPGTEQLEQIQALNRLFLTFLQSSLRGGGDALGLPHSVAGALRHADITTLDAVSTFPHALFRLQLEAEEAALVMDPPGTALEQARQSVALTILLTAWNLSRQSGYQARLFLGLDNHGIALLQSISLAELPRLARLPHLLRCAYADAESLWHALLRPSGGAIDPRLMLVALQPPTAAQRPWRSSAGELAPAG